MSAVVGATVLMAVLLYVDIPAMHRLLSPTAPPQPNIPADPR
jgi:hypothetical protein